MKIALFTSNQPRHIAFAHTLSKIADELFVVQECTTVFPGEVEDFYRKSDVMQRYFARVIQSEQKTFGKISFLPKNARALSMRMGDLSKISVETLAPALTADLIFIFGSSWIRGPLVEALIERQAINLHMGVSPWYRGTACNFWASYDGLYERIGGTVHFLSKGLDSGPVILQAFPPNRACDTFDLGMLAVQATHLAILASIRSGRFFDHVKKPVAQNASLELRYTRNRDFTDEIAAEYLGRLPSPKDVKDRLDRTKGTIKSVAAPYLFHDYLSEI